MMIDKKLLNDFKILNLLFIRKNLRSWIFVLFSLALPILIMVIFFFAFGFDSDQETQINNTLTFMPAQMLNSSILIGTTTVPMLFGLDRLSGKNKMFATMNINKKIYFLTLFTSSFIVFFLIINIQLILLNFWFLVGTLEVSIYFQLLFLNIYIFICFFFISLFIANIGKTSSQLFTAINIFFLFNLLFSGATIPTLVIDRDSILPILDSNGIPIKDAAGLFSIEPGFFKWIQYISPGGSGVRLSEIITIGDKYNNFTNWSTDWLAIIFPFILSTASFIYFAKKFEWVS